MRDKLETDVGGAGALPLEVLARLLDGKGSSVQVKVAKEAGKVYGASAGILLDNVAVSELSEEEVRSILHLVGGEELNREWERANLAVTQVTAQLTEKTAETTQKNRELEQKAAEVNQLRQAMEEKDGAVAQLQAKISEMESSIGEMQIELQKFREEAEEKQKKKEEKRRGVVCTPTIEAEVKPKILSREWKGPKLKFEVAEADTGVLAFLSRVAGRNAHEAGLITISASEVTSTSKEPTLIDYHHDKNDFYTSNMPEQWISIDFKDHKFVLMGFTLRNMRRKICSSAPEYPRNWDMRGSNDNSHWEVIQSFTNDTTMTDEHPYGTFRTPEKEPFRYIQLIMTGTNSETDSRYNYYLSLKSIEFYGFFVP